MSTPLPLHAPVTTLDDDAWADLLDFIEERRVIPIVGPELLQVETESGPRLLYDWIAEKLAGKLGVDVALLPKPYTLNDVVCPVKNGPARRWIRHPDARPVGGDQPGHDRDRQLLPEYPGERKGKRG